APYVHMMAEPGAQRYLAALHGGTGADAGGGHHELDILRAALVDGDDAALAMLRGQSALLGDAGGAAALGEGDSVTLKTEGTVGGTGKAGSGGFGVSGGLSGGASMTWTVARQNGMVTLTGTPASESGWSAGGTGAYGAGSMGYSHEHKGTS